MSNPVFKELIAEFEQALSNGQEIFLDLSHSGQDDQPIKPGKWTPREIIGHLIDSASNNHQRFVRAQIPACLKNGVLEIDGYDQNDWVKVGHYNSRDMFTLVELWDTYNEQLIHIIENTPSENLETQIRIGAGGAVTLEFLIRDYLRHLKHHLAQLPPVKA